MTTFKTHQPLAWFLAMLNVAQIEANFFNFSCPYTISKNKSKIKVRKFDAEQELCDKI